MAFNVTVTPQVQEVEVSATVQPYEVQVEVIDSPILDLTTNGTSGDATFDPFTGVLNIPNYTTDLSGVVPNSRTLTINGTAFDLSANRSWTVGDLLSSGSYANPSWITSLGWNKIASTPTTLSGYGITDAYTTGQVDTLLSAKQNNLILTTTGSSGASTLVGATLNIPNYTLSGLGGIGGSIVSGQVAFGSGVNTIGGSNNLFWDNANGRLGVGTNVPLSQLDIRGDAAGIRLIRPLAEPFIYLTNDSLTTNGAQIRGNITTAGLKFTNSTSLNTWGEFLSSGQFSLGNSATTARINSSGGPRALSLIDSNAVFRIWRFTSDTSLDGGIEFGWGANNDLTNAENRRWDVTVGSGDFFRIRRLTGGSVGNYFFINSNGNIGINTTTDSGFRLDVNGTARVQGDFTISDTRNIILATGTGTKIGTATSQKLSLWNATPDVQPTTAIVASAFVANTSGILDDTATFGGYTIGQVVAALRRIGALA